MSKMSWVTENPRKQKTSTWKPDSFTSVDARTAAKQELVEDEGKTHMSVRIGKAELKAKGLVVVMYDEDGVNSESGDDEFNDDDANTKDDKVIESEYEYVNPFHLLLDFSNMQPNFTVYVSKIIDFALLNMTIALNLDKI